MDDMDQASIKAGGEPSFFTGELERYSWTRIMDPRIGNQERMNLYSEALIKFSQAKQLPELFRDIARQTYFWALFRSARTASSRSRSPGPSRTSTSLRMPGSYSNT